MLRQIGNWGFVEIGQGKLASFSTGTPGAGWNFSSPDSWNKQRQSVGKHQIIPYGANNDLPSELRDLLDKFYSGEGILGKIAGLQWGEGPKLYREVYNEEENSIERKWMEDDRITAWLESFDYQDFIHRSLVDLTHVHGFFYKVFRTRGARLGMEQGIAKLEHVSVHHARLEAPEDFSDYPKRIIVADFPHPRIDKIAAYPIWEIANLASCGHALR